MALPIFDSTFPEDVQRVGELIKKDSAHDLYDEAIKLIIKLDEDLMADIVNMWRSLEKRRVGDDEVWVYAFLGMVNKARNLPPYYYISNQDRTDLVKQIKSTADTLAILLKRNELDLHIVFLDGKNVNGFYFYEGFGYSNQAGFDADNHEKLEVSTLLREVVEWADKEITRETSPGKASSPVVLL